MDLMDKGDCSWDKVQLLPRALTAYPDPVWTTSQFYSLLLPRLQSHSGCALTASSQRVSVLFLLPGAHFGISP
jgi:hypothetical protein